MEAVTLFIIFFVGYLHQHRTDPTIQSVNKTKVKNTDVIFFKEGSEQNRAELDFFNQPCVKD